MAVKLLKARSHTLSEADIQSSTLRFLSHPSEDMAPISGLITPISGSFSASTSHSHRRIEAY
jgi:hypothetical protein